MKKSLASIAVQNGFCENCAQDIREHLEDIDGIHNVCPHPGDALVRFHFARANELALALNKLMELGHPPIGDKIKKKNYVPPLCQCNKVGSSAA